MATVFLQRTTGAIELKAVVPVVVRIVVRQSVLVGLNQDPVIGMAYMGSRANFKKTP